MARIVITINTAPEKVSALVERFAPLLAECEEFSIVRGDDRVPTEPVGQIWYKETWGITPYLGRVLALTGKSPAELIEDFIHERYPKELGGEAQHILAQVA